MKRILICDDDVEIRDWLRLLLSECEVELTIVSGGEDALDAYAHARHGGESFDLLLCDLAMPYTNGFEVAQKIRAAGDSETPVLFMTAFDDDDSLCARAAELSVVPILHKPFKSVEDVYGAIESVLGVICGGRFRGVKEVT
ncbi:response regulator [bacterium]|nr:MAG: response regulator [bacterium]